MDWMWKQARGHDEEDGVFIHLVAVLWMTVPVPHQASIWLKAERLITHLPVNEDAQKGYGPVY